ncbi:protein of unknown function (plasmid) [Streptantibioticus cattleyicolor NRRL 8057 = DSM 46488]|nr:protein of unknown function [Streptantibioticus cattleyicolor NRRL 8057 = DSM 46488]
MVSDPCGRVKRRNSGDSAARRPLSVRREEKRIPHAIPRTHGDHRPRKRAHDTGAGIHHHPPEGDAAPGRLAASTPHHVRTRRGRPGRRDGCITHVIDGGADRTSGDGRFINPGNRAFNEDLWSPPCRFRRAARQGASDRPVCDGRLRADREPEMAGIRPRAPKSPSTGRSWRKRVPNDEIAFVLGRPTVPLRIPVTAFRWKPAAGSRGIPGASVVSARRPTVGHPRLPRTSH